MRLAATLMATAIFATSSAAQPVDGATARKMLFSANGFAVQIVEDGGLASQQMAYIRALVKTREFKDFSETIGYYGAIAMSPSFTSRLKSEGNAAAFSGLFQIAEGLHSPAAAEAAALGACNEARRRGEAPCALAARLLPKRWKPQPLSMSSSATAALRQYRRADTPKAFAVSTRTKAFSVVSGDNAVATALARCNAQADAARTADCKVVIAD